MKKNPLVSIIIPAYNSSLFIPKTLQSVIDQTYTNLECLIVDDGSTDDLKAAINPFLEKHLFIKYIHQDNKGLSSARNTGFSNAHGTYIQFLDADDLISPGKIEEQVSILEKHEEIGVSYTNYRPFNSDTGKLLDRYSHLITKENPLEDFLFKWERGLSMPVHSALFRKNIWKDNTVFNEQLRAKEDWAMWVSLALNGVKFHFLDKDYALYRMHDKNMSQDHMHMLSLFLKASYFIAEKLPIEYKDRFIVETKNYIFNSIKTFLYINKGVEYTSVNIISKNKHIPAIYNMINPQDKEFNYNFDLSAFPNIESVIWYPVGKNWCQIKISEFSCLDKNDNNIEIDLKDLKINGAIQGNGWLLFETFKPFIVIPVKDIKKIFIKGKLEILDETYIENKFDYLNLILLDRKKQDDLLHENLTGITNSPEWNIFIKYFKLKSIILADGSRRKSFCKGILNLLRNPRGTINNLKIKANLTFRSLTRPNTVQKSNRYDVIFFSIIDWDFRYQRPQHIAARFAKNGHRVLYVSVNLKAQASYSKSILAENIYNIMLPFNKNTSIYNIDIDIDNTIKTLTSAFDAIFKDFSIKESVAFVEFPLWSPVVSYLKDKYETKVIFDCLDEFSGFTGVHDDINQIEDELLMSSDFCFSTSLKLYDKHKAKCKNISLIRNATEFEHFHKLPPNDLLKDIKKPIIGYYGAIAEWFDTETIKYISSEKPDWNIVLIGNTQGSTVNILKRKYSNIHVLGEKPYNELPKYLYWFDVCMIPFKLNDLIISTNPIKFYEYISSGKPVVSSGLPELMPYADLLYISKNKNEFLENIDKALKENDEDLIQRRIELAKANDWESRFTDISNCIRNTFPKVCVIIVTFNNLKYTKLCVESIYAKTAYPNVEIIIVDNASTDGTEDYLNDLKEEHANIKIILNKDNLGFAAANNIGIKASSGEYIILLNNDTVVTRGWISGLISHLQNPEIGMVGPLTNSIGNEAKINVNYSALSSMDKFAEHYTEKNTGRTFEIPVLAMYCLAMRRQTIETIGPLDEQFSIGMFEDDDYALRVRKAGLKVICTENVFIHHFGGASFGKLKSAEYQNVFNENRTKFEQKWDRKWIPHTYRNGVK